MNHTISHYYLLPNPIFTPSVRFTQKQFYLLPTLPPSLIREVFGIDQTIPGSAEQGSGWVTPVLPATVKD